jgi:hypothetical protein
MDGEKILSIILYNYMKYETLKKHLDSGLSLHQITKLENKSLTTVRYWVKKHKLTPNFKNFSEEIFNKIAGNGETNTKTKKYCPNCGETHNRSNFYQRRGVKGSSVYCKECTGKQTLGRLRKLKIQMVEYKGGKCQNPNCTVLGGYDRCMGALEFHHIDPKEKDFTPSKLKRYKFNEVVKKELDKCMLLCANCHREIHEKK